MRKKYRPDHLLFWKSLSESMEKQGNACNILETIVKGVVLGSWYNNWLKAKDRALFRQKLRYVYSYCYNDDYIYPKRMHQLLKSVLPILEQNPTILARIQHNPDMGLTPDPSETWKNYALSCNEIIILRAAVPLLNPFQIYKSEVGNKESYRKINQAYEFSRSILYEA